MNEGLVSIIMPTYNSAKTVINSINSILDQSYSNWELIVSDDCSVDNTIDIVTKLSFTDSRIVVIKSNINNGAAIARNKAINHAKGKYIAFLDSDDTWEPRKLELQLDFMAKNDYVFTYTNYYVLQHNGRIRKYRPVHKTTYKKSLLNNPIGCLTVIYDSEKLGKIYMPENAKKREDFATWLKILKTTQYAHGLDEYLATYYIGKQSVSSNKMRMLKYQYNLYRRVENINPFTSVLLILIYSINKLLKY